MPCDVPGCSGQTHLGWRPLTERIGRKICDPYRLDAGKALKDGFLDADKYRVIRLRTGRCSWDKQNAKRQRFRTC